MRGCETITWGQCSTSVRRGARRNWLANQNFELVTVSGCLFRCVRSDSLLRMRVDEPEGAGVAVGVSVGFGCLLNSSIAELEEERS